MYTFILKRQKTSHDHSRLIQQNHINKNKIYLNRYGTITFVNTVSKFLSEYYCWDHDDSNKKYLVQDNCRKELQSYLQVLPKKNQTNVSTSI